MSNGKILFQGSSLIDGKPIVVIAIGLNNSSRNKKTGGMIQTYILRSDIAPIKAIQSGEDYSICGNCPKRGIATGTANEGRECYVTVGQGPTVVYKSFKRGAYPVAVESELASIGENRNVRLGTYGDPAAAPAYIWQLLVSKSAGHTGYTHQWRNASALKNLCMASADSESDAIEAHAKGWRTFRVALPTDAPKLAKESVCPASAEAGKKLTCETCMACSGANGRKGSIVIQAHGGFAVMANIKKRTELGISA